MKAKKKTSSKRVDVAYCLNCGTKLGVHIDDTTTSCATCQAEEQHDFDAEPNVKFDRAGNEY